MTMSNLGVDTGSFAGLNAATVGADIWISDRAGEIGLFNTATGALEPGTLHKTTVHGLTDIGFLGKQMYGTTFNELGTINDKTGKGIPIGTYEFNDGINALVGDGSDTVLVASHTSDDIWKINIKTDKVTVYAKSGGLDSAGDLAWAGHTLYESVVEGGADALYNVSAHKLVGYFEGASGAPVGHVFGLADSGSEMFAVVGNSIYSVDLADAHLTYLSSDKASGIGAASGAAFVNENLHH
jgi:hypothetical protein